MAKRRSSKAEREHMGRVAELGCCLCKRPATVHHIRSGVGTGQRASDYDTIPLCPDHHQLGGHGVAIHAGRRTWEENFGSELHHLILTKILLGID